MKQTQTKENKAFFLYSGQLRNQTPYASILCVLDIYTSSKS